MRSLLTLALFCGCQPQNLHQKPAAHGCEEAAFQLSREDTLTCAPGLHLDVDWQRAVCRCPAKGQTSDTSCSETVVHLYDGIEMSCGPKMYVQMLAHDRAVCRCGERPQPKAEPVAESVPTTTPQVVVEAPNMVAPVVMHHGLKLLLVH